MSGMLLLFGTSTASAALLPPVLTSLLARLTPVQLCSLKHVGEKCDLGLGVHPGECAGCVVHADWPSITGIRAQVTEDAPTGHALLGGPANDELLGRHGSDVIVAAGGDDVIWGDSQHVNNNTSQRDTLFGLGGNDWIYASHGYNKIFGGSGDDQVIAYFGHGAIDCGPGRDTVTIVHKVRLYVLKSCEIIKHPGN